MYLEILFINTQVTDCATTYSLLNVLFFPFLFYLLRLFFYYYYLFTEICEIHLSFISWS